MPQRNSAIASLIEQPLSSPTQTISLSPKTIDGAIPIHQIQIANYIEAHRIHGYRTAQLDPLNLTAIPAIAELTPEFHGLNPSHDHQIYKTDFLPEATLAELSRHLKAVYSGSPIGLDCSGVREENIRRWLFARMESEFLSGLPSPLERLSTLKQLIAAETWEHQVQLKFHQVKVFSLEGCESLLPLLHTLIKQAGLNGVKQLFMGMPHRGRLNVLVNVMDFPRGEMFALLDQNSEQALSQRDLQYHLGFTTVKESGSAPVSVYLAHNPSHLQSVYPVVCGMTRAFMDNQNDALGRLATPIIIHGDAAFSGQGVVMEALNLSKTRGFSTGGTIHVVVNNQVGFTTSNPMDARSGIFCTDIARMIDAPVLHVNADHVDHVVRAAKIAFDFRMAFGADIIIDLVGYRRRGHTEQDLPGLTQPAMQAAIQKHPTITSVYSTALKAAGILNKNDMANLQADAVRLVDGPSSSAASKKTTHRRANIFTIDTSVPLERLRELVINMTDLPTDFQVHDEINVMIQEWHKAVQRPNNLADWRFAENLAYGSLLANGYGIRISGMDVGRGTFFHRHAVWHEQGLKSRNELDVFIPLQNISSDQGVFDIYDSPLSEEAVVGFEYGYSVQSKRKLVIWEAQYGDFVNSAQVMIDQYITSGEAKWGYKSALMILLPHGNEGVGPEHSNAHLGRFLQLCAEENIRVVYPSNSAQWFHLLRLQAMSIDAKPIVVITPKSQLYANTHSHSSVITLSQGRFNPIIGDSAENNANNIKRVIICSGKLYYDLLAALHANKDASIALLRLEQLYPFPTVDYAREIARYPGLEELVWAQEEHKNQGAWQFVRDYLEADLPAGVKLECICRPATAGGATSSATRHLNEQRELIRASLGIV
jgi:2-oxoglutarate dehydrogenase E1 component